MGVLNYPLRNPPRVDPDDTLTPEESALVKKAKHEMRQGKFVTLDELRHDLERPRPRRSRKTAKGSLGNKLSISRWVRMDFVVPIAVKLVAPKSDARKFLVVDFGSRMIDAVIDFGVNL